MRWWTRAVIFQKKKITAALYTTAMLQLCQSWCTYKTQCDSSVERSDAMRQSSWCTCKKQGDNSVDRPDAMRQSSWCAFKTQCDSSVHRSDAIRQSSWCTSWCTCKRQCDSSVDRSDAMRQSYWCTFKTQCDSSVDRSEAIRQSSWCTFKTQCDTSVDRSDAMRQSSWCTCKTSLVRWPARKEIGVRFYSACNRKLNYSFVFIPYTQLHSRSSITQKTSIILPSVIITTPTGAKFYFSLFYPWRAENVALRVFSDFHVFFFRFFNPRWDFCFHSYV